jgi:hypothetical protein
MDGGGQDDHFGQHPAIIAAEIYAHLLPRLLRRRIRRFLRLLCRHHPIHSRGEA